jgi:hypothetical protein
MENQNENDLIQHDEAAWRHVFNFSDSQEQASYLSAETRNLEGLLRRKLRRGMVLEQLSAIAVFECLPASVQYSLFGDVFFLCGSPKFGQAAQAAVSLMSRAWVASHFAEAMEAQLLDPDTDNVACIMYLGMAKRLDPDLARRVASKLLSHADPDMREVGEDFLKADQGLL